MPTTRSRRCTLWDTLRPRARTQNNVKLAANRAAAVKNYLVNNKLVDASLITVDSSPANWDALKQMLTESCINDYRRIIV